MSNDIKLLHPALRVKAEQLVNLCKAAGINIQISSTLRTKAEQDPLYAQGRTTPGKIVTKAPYPQSLHNWGVAFDVVVIGKDGKADWRPASYKPVGKIGLSIGLAWGGSWLTFKDYPHFELKGYKWSVLKKKYGTPQKFIQSWPTSATNPAINIKAGDKLLPGIIISGKAHAPVRALVEALGGFVEWNAELNAALILPVAVKVAASKIPRVVTGNVIIPGQMLNGKMFVIVKDLAQALGHTVEWDSQSRTVFVK